MHTNVFFEVEWSGAATPSVGLVAYLANGNWLARVYEGRSTTPAVFIALASGLGDGVARSAVTVSCGHAWRDGCDWSRW